MTTNLQSSVCLLPGKLSLHSDKLISCTNNQAACEAGKCPKSAGEAILKRDFPANPGDLATTWVFNDFSREWGFQQINSTPTYPQSIGKAATVKRSFVQHGQVYSWTQGSWPGPSSSIKTHHHRRTDCHLHRSSLGTLSRPTTVHSLLSGNRVPLRPMSEQCRPRSRWRIITTSTPVASLISWLAPMSQSKTTEVRIGTFMVWSPR